MGLFDRIRQQEQEEVELQPNHDERVQPVQREAEQEDEPEEFLLPGMESGSDTAAEQSDGSRGSAGSGRSARNTVQEEVSLERVVEQNERIIDLLEQLVDVDTGDSNEEEPAVPW